MGFDFGQLVDDAGKQLQTDATSWLRGEISSRLQPVQVQPQPTATLTVAQNDATKTPSLGDNKKMLYLAGAIIGLLVLVFALKKRTGGKRGK